MNKDTNKQLNEIKETMKGEFNKYIGSLKKIKLEAWCQ
jgi:hypothetical protein